MTVDEIKNRLKELSEVKASSLTPLEKEEIEQLYEQVLDKKFVPTSCSDCYIDACILAYNHLNRFNSCVPHREYRMKVGACVQIEFGSAEMLCTHNCTDEKARDYLRRHPEDINLFATYPENWKEDCKKSTLTEDNSENVQDNTTPKKPRARRKRSEINE